MADVKQLYGRKYRLSIGNPVLITPPPEQNTSPEAVAVRRKVNEYAKTFETSPVPQAVALDRGFTVIDDLQIKATIYLSLIHISEPTRPY